MKLKGVGLMEMNMRDWMIVIGVLLFLLVVLDGFRRAQRERKNQVRMSRKAEKQRFGIDDDVPLSELPNGGNKRLAGQSENNILTDDDRNDPLFVNPFEHDDIELPAESPTVTSLSKTLDEANSCEQVVNEIVHLEPAVDDAILAEDEPVKEVALTEVEFEEEVQEIDFSVEQMLTAEELETEAVAEVRFNVEEVEELLLMHVVPQATEGFEQANVFHILKECDMRLNNASLFERFEQADGQGAVQFSVANSSESGRFLVSSDDQELKGVSLFMRLPGPERPIEAFDAMVAVAKCIASNLNGAIKDELDSTMTEQTLQHNRQRIKDYLQRRLVKHG